MKTVFIYLLVAMLPHTALAQFYLEKVIHSQELSPDSSEWEGENYGASVLGQEEIENQAPTSIDDALRQAPSATTARGPRNSSESIQVRGLDASKIFIMVDGARQNFRGDHTSMIPVDLENLKAVEIYESSADFSKGNSLGGGIQFVTKDPEDYLGENQQFGGEFKYQNNSANAENLYNAKNIFKRSSYSGLVSLTSQKAGNVRLNNGETLANSAYEDFVGFFKLKSGAWTLSHELFQRDDNNPLDPSLNPPATIQSLLADSSMTKNTTILKRQTKDLLLNVYFNRFETEKTDREEKNTERRSLDTIGGSFRRQAGATRFGAEGYQDSLDSDKQGVELTSFPKARSVNLNAYIERDFSLGSFTATPGLRVNHYSMQDSRGAFPDKSAEELSKKLFLKYSFSDENFFYASYSEGFNAPRVDEVYPSGLHSPGDGWMVRDNYFEPNLDLKHETSANKEFGFSGKKYLFDYTGSASFKASVYDNDVENYIKIERIDRSVMDDEDGSSKFVNVPRAKLHGAEAQLGFNYDIYELKLAYSRIRGKNETENLYLEDLPADQFTYAFNIYLDRYRAQFGYLGIQAQEQNRINPHTLQRTEETPGYFIHNVYAKKDIGDNFELGLRVDNLGNKKYRRHGSFLYESEEDYKITFKYKVNTL